MQEATLSTGADGAEQTAVADAAEPPRRGRGSRLGGSLAQTASRYSLILVWGLMIAVYAGMESDRFLTKGAWTTIFGSQQALVFLALALVVTFIVGEFDLSVASVLGLSATLVPVLNVLHGVDVVLACIIAVLAATAAGAINGFLVVVMRVNPIVVTLGMSTLLLGVSLEIAQLNTVSGLDTSFSKISLTEFGGLPVSFFYGVAVALIFAYVLRFTPLGRHMVFVGANREVARLAGIRVNRIRFGAYTMSGLICGVGGVVLVAGLGGFDPNSSVTYLLPAFAGAFLGTAVVNPGRFNPLGSLISIYFLVTGIVGLQLLGFSGWITNVFYGAALIVAVTVSTIVNRRAT
jgi:ribose transport system permease protein